MAISRIRIYMLRKLSKQILSRQTSLFIKIQNSFNKSYRALRHLHDTKVLLQDLLNDFTYRLSHFISLEKKNNTPRLCNRLPNFPIHNSQSTNTTILPFE